jgi:hypothetical protein
MLQLTLALEARQLAAACNFSAGTYFFSDQLRFSISSYLGG